MNASIDRILALEVPIIVLLGRREMPLRDVISLIPGAIIELPKAAAEELELLVNNKVVGVGTAVKVGENFGLRLSRIGSPTNRIRAMSDGSQVAAPAGEADASGSSASDEDAALAALAEQMLSGQT